MTGNERRIKRHMFMKRQHVIRYLWMFVAASTAILGGEQLFAQANVTAVIEATALTHQVVYSVDVSILDSASLSEPIKLVIESQFGEAEQEVYGGITEGVFENLRPNTLYTLRLIINQGLGYVPIAKTSVRTLSGLSGGLGVVLESMDYGHGESLISFSIQAYLDDPEAELLGATLRYAIIPFEDYLEGSITDPTQFDSISLNLLSPSVTIGPFFNDGQRLVLYLDGATTNGVIELANRTFAFPINFFYSLSILDAGPDYITVSPFVFAPQGITATYELELWDESKRIASATWIPQDDDHDSDNNGIRFDRLLKMKPYSLRLIANYTDPLSKLTHRVTLGSIEALTTPVYTLTIRRFVEGDQVRFTIDLWDPSGVILAMNWRLYAPDSNTHLFVPIELIASGTNRYTATWTITPQENESTSIWITADKLVDETTTYFGAVVAAYTE
jgi:hypothetical protein